MYIKNCSTIDNIETNKVYQYKDFFPVLNFRDDIYATLLMLKDSIYIKENENLYDKEFEQLETILNKIKNLPRSESDIYKYNIENRTDITKLNTYLKTIEEQQKILDTIWFNVIQKSLYQTELGKNLINRFFKIIKRPGGTGATTIATQEISFHNYKKTGEAVNAYWELDTEKTQEKTRIPSCNIGDGENTLIFAKSPKARLKTSTGYTLDLMNIWEKIVGHWRNKSTWKAKQILKLSNKTINTLQEMDLKHINIEDSKISISYKAKEEINKILQSEKISETEKESLYRIYQSAHPLNIYTYRSSMQGVNAELIKSLRLNELTPSSSLKMAFLIFIFLAEKLSEYEIIIMDEGPINTYQHAFLSVFIKNHILPIPFDDIDVAKHLFKQKEDISGSISFYKNLISELNKFYSEIDHSHQIEHNLILAIDERNATEDNDSKNTSEFYNTINNARNIIEKDFSQKTGINEENIISVVFPFYKEAYNDENISHRVVLPLVVNAPNKLHNKHFEKSLLFFDKIITELKDGNPIVKLKGLIEE